MADMLTDAEKVADYARIAKDLADVCAVIDVLLAAGYFTEETLEHARVVAYRTQEPNKLTPQPLRRLWARS